MTAVSSAINCFSCELNRLLFSWISLKESLTDKLRLLKRVSLADLFLNMNACHFQENKWSYLLPLIKFELSSESIVDSSPTLQGFPNEMSGDTVIFGYCWVKCSNIGKICLNHSFPNDQGMMLQNQEGVKDVINVKDEPGGF